LVTNTIGWSHYGGGGGYHTSNDTEPNNGAGGSGIVLIRYEQGAVDASGGTTVMDETIGGTTYRIHAFENVGTDTFTVENLAEP